MRLLLLFLFTLVFDDALSSMDRFPFHDVRDPSSPHRVLPRSDDDRKGEILPRSIYKDWDESSNQWDDTDPNKGKAFGIEEDQSHEAQPRTIYLQRSDPTLDTNG